MGNTKFSRAEEYKILQISGITYFPKTGNKEFSSDGNTKISRDGEHYIGLLISP